MIGRIKDLFRGRHSRDSGGDSSPVARAARHRFDGLSRRIDTRFFVRPGIFCSRRRKTRATRAAVIEEHGEPLVTEDVATPEPGRRRSVGGPRRGGTRCPTDRRRRPPGATRAGAGTRGSRDDRRNGGPRRRTGDRRGTPLARGRSRDAVSDGRVSNRRNTRRHPVLTHVTICWWDEPGCRSPADPAGTGGDRR